MKSKQIIYAIALSAGLLTAGSTMKLVSAKQAELAQAEIRAVKAHQLFEHQKDVLQTALTLDETKNQTEQPKDNGKAFTKAYLGLQAMAVAHGVEHSMVSIAGVPLNQQSTAINSFFKPLPGTGGRISTATLTVKGRYKDYSSFRNYLKSIGNLSASIRQLVITNTNFDMAVRIYAAH